MERTLRKTSGYALLLGLLCGVNLACTPMEGVDLKRSTASIAIDTHSSALTQAQGPAGSCSGGSGQSGNSCIANAYSPPQIPGKFNDFMQFLALHFYSDIGMAKIDEAAYYDYYNLFGCVRLVQIYVRGNLANHPWNPPVYIQNLRGVGKGNNSYNQNFMTSVYQTIFFIPQSTYSINYFEPALDNGTSTASGLTEQFLADEASIRDLNCTPNGM
jgi:hypothetical protein